MRIQKWSAWLLGLALLARCESATRAADPAEASTAGWAQPDPAAGAGYAFSEGEPPFIQQQQNGADPYGGYGPDGQPYMYHQGPYPHPEVPDTMQAWPPVTPYEPDFNQTRRDKMGVWYNQQRSGGRQWWGDVDVWFTTSRRPNGADSRNQVGFPVVLGNDQTFGQSQGGLLGGIGGIGGVGGGVGGVGGGGVGGVGAGNGVAGAGPGIQPGTAHYTRDLATTDPFKSIGYVPYIGFNNVDESGFEMGGFYVQKSDQGLFENNRTFPVLINRGSQITGNLDATANPILPLRFDNAFSGDASTRVYGADMSFITTPVLGRGNNRVRLMYGIRYYGLQEDINYSGKDSLTANTFIETKTFTQMIGPQGGARWELGGKNFKLIGTGKLGVLGNLEQVDVVGLNYFGTNTNGREKHGHISPTMNFTIMGELPLFGYLPGFKKIPFIRDANFRVGYDYSVLFLVVRPADSINYGVYSPQVDIHRTVFDVHGTRLGISWKW